MFERFTDRARNTVVLAQEEARLLSHNYIGTEHLLLALVRDGESVAGRALRRLGIELETVRTDVLEMIGTGGQSPSGHIPFTPRAKKVLELSLREALQLGHNYIGTEHILLGLLREGEGVAAQVLVQRGVGLDRVRAAVMVELTGQGSPLPPSPASRTPAAEDALAAARQLAAGGPVGSHHLLEALARSEDSAAGKALASLGVDPDALAAALDAVGIDGTTDVTAVEGAARLVEIDIVDDGVHIVLRDQATVELVQAITSHLGGSVRGDDPACGSLVGLWQAIANELDSLKQRLMPAPAEDASEPTRIRIVRHAMRDRLRRRER